jgi:hypothetical protein
MLQQLVARGAPVGKLALVVGAEHVSFSALITLAHGGTRTVGMATELPRHQSLPLVRAGAALRYRAPVWARTAVARIRGRPRVEEVELVDLDSGRTRAVACDTVVFTADWIPDHELAIARGLELDPGTRGPRVDTGLRTTEPGIFATGNLLHGAEPADVAALEGRHVAAQVARWLEDRSWPTSAPVECEPPLQWLAPNAIGAEKPPRGSFLVRSRTFETKAPLEIRQDGGLLWRGRVRVQPGRSARVPSGWPAAVDPDGGVVRIAIRRG